MRTKLNWVFSGIFFFLFLLQCSKTPQVITTGHRGASGSAPENTLASLRRAMELGAQFSEIDVQETKDGRIILLHDDTLNRTTNDSGAIWEKNWDEIKPLDAGFWFSNECAGEPVPLLEEAIDLVNGKMKLNIELKVNDHEEKLAERVVRIIENKKFAEQCIVTSFDFPTALRVVELNPEIKTGFIFGRMPENYDIWSSSVPVLSIHKNLATAEFINHAHAVKKEVHVWTVNDTTKMQELVDLGVDNIITNYPERLQKVLEKQGS